MYDWLGESLQGSGTVVTANRRLARVLRDEFGARQLSAGATAWRTPAIVAWQDWLVTVCNGARQQDVLPMRINAHQSQWLWERCLRKELGDADVGIANLVRQSRDAWQRLADWRVSIRELARSAQNREQRLFAAAAGRYLGLLQRENMVDGAGLGELVLDIVAGGRSRLQGRHTFAGFEQRRPIDAAVQEALASIGIAAGFAPHRSINDACSLAAYENSEAELRAAGAWARRQIERNPEARVAIVAGQLDTDGERIARQVRDGVTPGWQHGGPGLLHAVNVSYGRRLSEYPAVAIALILLRWLVDELASTDVSLLLRSPLLASGGLQGRSRLELLLRRLPDRRWSPSMITAELRGREQDADTGDWLTRLAAFSKRRRELPKTAAPGDWVIRFDETLSDFGWPGAAPLGSADFQLVNRWRELLNEFARLALVSPKMTAATALARLELLATDTVFQPESPQAQVQLIGPLEASGSQFDALWLSGMSTANWPPAGVPSVLISRRLQEKHGMPDCTPDNTMQYARRLLTHLVESADTVVCSYALTEDDAEQTVSDLLRPLLDAEATEQPDPGLYAATLTAAATTPAADRVPAVGDGERLSGGATTLQRQLHDPVSAFVYGRMGGRLIYPQAVGIPALLRGNLVHDALYKLYIDLPSSSDLRAWTGEDLDSRIAAALDFAFARHERNGDAVLKQLLALERRRIAGLLREFVAVDADRGEFRVAGVEGRFEFVAGPVRLSLRFDRFDSFDDGSVAILVYKTGSGKRLLNREQQAQEIQLFVYAAAIDAPVSALALVNVDSRQIVFDGAGRGYTDIDEWPGLLRRVTAEVDAACREMADGDVRINIEQSLQEARPLNLLTRYSELRRERR